MTLQIILLLVFHSGSLSLPHHPERLALPL